jgi:hypothetical protein
MKPWVEFVKTTLLGGLLFLIPVVLIVLLVQQALSLAGHGYNASHGEPSL